MMAAAVASLEDTPNPTSPATSTASCTPILLASAGTAEEYRTHNDGQGGAESDISAKRHHREPHGGCQHQLRSEVAGEQDDGSPWLFDENARHVARLAEDLEHACAERLDGHHHDDAGDHDRHRNQKHEAPVLVGRPSAEPEVDITEGEPHQQDGDLHDERREAVDGALGDCGRRRQAELAR